MEYTRRAQNLVYMEYRALNLVDFTLENYYRQKRVEFQKDPTKMGENIASPTETVVFNECRQQALTKGIFGFIIGALTTTAFFRFATKLRRVQFNPVFITGNICGYLGALSNRRSCTIKFLLIPEEESEGASLCRKQLSEEFPDSTLWKEVQEIMKKSGSKKVSSDYNWKHDDIKLSKMGVDGNFEEQKFKNKTLTDGFSVTTGIKDDDESVSVSMHNKDRDLNVRTIDIDANDNKDEDDVNYWTLDNYIDDGLRQEYDQNSSHWMNEGNNHNMMGEEQETNDESVSKQYARANKSLRVDEEYDLLYEGALQFHVAGGTQSVWGQSQQSAKPTTWEEIRRRRRGE
jgi:hypothetical protein